ncbi:zinc chelation protein SecC [Methyloprofundus sedimenti]|uniref:Zinc chelation protein SecC n=1 Tax=Methyloprofundus sedimenti TaxID=1420851 RepID=A0A1V8M665_9GAMM|nr:trypsin-like peptidase domain-containing protein [Methyloprofundus sedimenti]OQK17080.1 zinc chelation protein SecC [Methyloprofundus sedimenti]
MSDYINPIEQLIHSTVRIQCGDDKNIFSSGTGYIFFFCENGNQGYPCIVTNKHVVSGASRGIFNLTIQDDKNRPILGNHEEIILNDLPNFCIPHPSPDIDLVAIPIGPILNNAQLEGKHYHYIYINKGILASEELLNSLPSMEDIVMIGYPNGIWDAKHNLPIIRRGITATHPRLPLNGKSEFMIDAACFPGSSGSPVFLANIGSFVDASGALCTGSRIALLGTLYAVAQHTTTGEIEVIEVPTDTKTITSHIPNNLGLVIHAKELLKLEIAVQKQLTPKPLMNRNALCLCGSGKRFKNCCGKIT